VLGAGIPFYLARLHDTRALNLIIQARDGLSTGDLRGAYLFASQAVQLRPRDPAPHEILGRVADKEHSPEAILRYQEVVDLVPDKVPALVALANVAMRYGEVQTAEQALSQVPGEKRQTVAYQQSAAACAIKQGSPGAAEEHFKAAIALDPAGPENRALQLDLATLYLGAANPDVVRQARSTIDSFRGDAALRLPALRALLADARARKDGPGAEAFARELMASPGAGFDDQLLYIETLLDEKDARFEEELSSMQQKAGGDFALAYTLMVWMNAHGVVARSIAWYETLDPRLKKQVPVRLAAAEAFAAAENWDGLMRLTGINGRYGENWGALEFLRIAFHARAMVGTGSRLTGSNFKHEWESAIIATQGNMNALGMLARLVQGWGWKAQAARAWWLVARGSAGPTAALEALFLMANEDKDAAELYRISRRIYQLRPADVVARNNIAMLGLLLAQDVAEAHQLAAGNYKQYPLQPDIASTYAFSLYLDGRGSEAAKVLATLPGASLRQPSIEVCYGAVLMATGQGDSARPVLQDALRHKEKLFPQEIALAEKLFPAATSPTRAPN